MYRIEDETSPQIGRVIDVVSSRDSVPQADDTRHIVTEEEPFNHADMPFQFVKVNHFKHLTASERRLEESHSS